MEAKSRQNVFVDRKVQGTLALRVGLYWLLLVGGMFCLLVGFPLVVSFFVRSPGSPTTSQIVSHTVRVFWPMLFAAALILPFIVLDVIRISHRFAGPAFRFQQALRDLADGKPVAPIELRNNDFWGDTAHDFNRAIARWQTRETNGVRQG